MKLNEEFIKKYLKDNTKSLLNLVKKYKGVFDKIEEYRKKLLVVDTNNLPEIKKILLTLTGYYMSLCNVVKKLQTLKRNKESAYFHQRKIEIENEGKKFTSAPIEKEASLYVAEERRVRNIFEGYLDACLEGMRTCRSFLNSKDELFNQ